MDGVHALPRAHKAANPSKYPIKDEIRAMYPPLIDIEKRFGPTPVHLQIYDGQSSLLSLQFGYRPPDH
jgi:hypothetical protein